MAHAIRDLIIEATTFSEVDLSKERDLMDISNSLKMVNNWILRLNDIRLKEKDELPETR